MDKLTQFSCLFGDIYDAALDPDKWDGVLEKICNFVDGAAGSLGSFDLLSSKISLSKVWGFDSTEMQLWNELYSKINPLAPPQT